MSDSSETVYRFGGDASDLIAELKLVRSALVGAGTEATKTGSTIDKATKGLLLAPISTSADKATKSLTDLSKATTTLGATAHVNFDTVTTSLGATAMQSAKLATATIATAEAQTVAAVAAKALTPNLAAVGMQSKMNAAQMQQMSYQLNDFFVQVAGGQGVLMPLIQQGSQLSGTFGGVGGALRAVTSLFSPFVVGIGLVAAAIGSIGFAFYNGAQEAKEFKDSMRLTGGFAGVTADAFRNLTVSVAAFASVSKGAAREALQAVVASGRFAGESVKEVAIAVTTLAKITGKDATDIMADFAGMSDGVAKWAAEHNKSYHYLTGEQFKYIRQLESQGRIQEAVAFNTKALNDALAQSKTNLGYLEKAWGEVKLAAKNAWDSMLDIGRPDTLGDKVKKAATALADARKSLDLAPRSKDRQNLVGALEKTLADAQAAAAIEEKAATDKAAAAEKNSRDILHQQDAYQSASASLTSAGLAAQQGMRELARTKEKIALDRAYSEMLVGTREYTEKNYAIEKGALDDKLRMIEAERAIEASRQPGDEAATISQQARLVEIGSRRYAVESQLMQLAERHRRFDDAPTNGPKAIETANQQFRRLEAEQTAATNAAFDQRRDNAAVAAHDLVRINEFMSADLIQDDRRRAGAMLAIEEREMRARIDMGALSVDERKKAEEDFAAWRVNREAQVTESLKPAWQKRVELWEDTNRLMKQSYDEFVTGWQDAGEDAWVAFATTGKVNIKGITDFAVKELAKLAYQKSIGPAFTEAGKSLAGLFGATVGGKEAGATVNPAQTQQTLAVNQSTASFTTLVAAIDAAAVALAKMGGGGAGGLGGLFGGDAGYTIDYGGSTTNLTGGSLPTAGGLAGGGKAKRGRLHPVNEQGPELLTVGGSDYLMMGAKDGNVTSNRALSERARSPYDAAQAPASAGGSPNVVVNIKNEAGDVAHATATPNSDGGIDVLFKRFEQQLGANVSRGRGPVSAGMRSRGVNLNGGLPRVG